MQASAAATGFSLYCSWFVVSSCVKLLHLVSVNTAAKTILMLDSFYCPACSALLPQDSTSSHVQNLLFILLIRLICLSKGWIAACKHVDWSIFAELHFPVARHKAEEGKSGSKGQKWASKWEKTQRKLLFYRNWRERERLTLGDKQGESKGCRWSRRHEKKQGGGETEGHY